MIYVIREDPIESLSLPQRIYNCLKRNNIDTIGDFLSTQESGKWQELYYMGAKSIGYIEHFIASLHTGEEGYFLLDTEEERAGKEAQAKMLSEAFAPQDSPIETLPLSVRTISILQDAGYQNASDLLSVSEEELRKIKRLGTKSREEIQSVISAYLKERDKQPLPEATSALSRFDEASQLAKDMSYTLDASEMACLKVVLSVLDKDSEIDGSD